MSTMGSWSSARPFSGKTLKATSGASWENDARRSVCATIRRHTGTRTRIDASLRTGPGAPKAKQRSTGARDSRGNARVRTRRARPRPTRSRLNRASHAVVPCPATTWGKNPAPGPFASARFSRVRTRRQSTAVTGVDRYRPHRPLDAPPPAGGTVALSRRTTVLSVGAHRNGRFALTEVPSVVRFAHQIAPVEGLEARPFCANATVPCRPTARRTR